MAGDIARRAHSPHSASFSRTDNDWQIANLFTLTGSQVLRGVHFTPYSGQMTLEVTYPPVRGSASRAFVDDLRFLHNEAWWDSEQVWESSSVQFGTRVNYSFSGGEEEVARASVCAARAPLRGYEGSSHLRV